MADTLDGLKKELYETFNVAVKYGKSDITNYNNNPSHEAGASALQAAAQIARTITLIEKEQREAAEAAERKHPTLAGKPRI